MHEVIFKNKEDETDSRLKVIKVFLEKALNHKAKEGKRDTLTRCMEELCGKGTTSIGSEVFTSEDVFGSMTQFQMSKYFEVVSSHKKK